MTKVLLTEEEIKDSKVPENYKEALLEAYETAKIEDNGYFFEPACKALKYIIGLSDEIPRGQSGIENFDDMIDDNPNWSETDKRIVTVILDDDRKEDEEYSDTKFYEISSWLWSRLDEVEDDEFFTEIFEIFKERQIITDEYEAIRLLIWGYSGVLMPNDGKVTSFGKVTIKYFDKLWKAALEMEDIGHNAEKLYDLYELFKELKPEEYSKIAKTLVDEMVKSGSNGKHYAKQLLTDVDPEYALELAKQDGPMKYKRTAYSVYHSASDTEKEKYKQRLWEVYEGNGVDKESAERIIEIWGKEGLTLLNQLYDENSSMLGSAVDMLDEQFGELAIEAYAKAFSSNQEGFDGAGYLTEHKDFLERIYNVLSKYNFSEYAVAIIERLVTFSGNDLKTAAKLLGKSGKYIESAVLNKHENGTDAEKEFAKLIKKNIK